VGSDHRRLNDGRQAAGDCLIEDAAKIASVEHSRRVTEPIATTACFEIIRKIIRLVGPRAHIERANVEQMGFFDR
jgi:hypothetical protein